MDEISGIYNMGSDTILLKQENDSIWNEIMLSFETEEWSKGKIRLRLNLSCDNKFEIFKFYLNGMLFYQYEIKISDGRIDNTFWNKANKCYLNKNQDHNFFYDSQNQSFDYIAIKTLKRTNALTKGAKEFYAKKLE